MKAQQRIFWDFVIFLTCFVAATVLYKEVYTEESSGLNKGLVLISEVRPTGGVGKVNDEFVELYNPQNEPVVIGGWSINKLTKSASSTDHQQIFVFPKGVVIPSQAHVLVSHTDSLVTSSADYLYAGQSLSDDNTIVLINDDGKVIDLVGYGLAKNVEIEAAEAPSVQHLSIERKPGGDLGNGYDTNNNKLDFFRTQSNPQNLHSQPTPVANDPPQVITTTTQTTSTEPITVDHISTSTLSNVLENVNVTTTIDLFSSSTIENIDAVQTTSSLVLGSIEQSNTSSVHLMGSILITELYPIPKSGENEFVELFNRTPQTVDLTNWYVTDGSGAKTVISGTLASMQYLVIEKPKGSLNNDGDIVSVVAPNETIIDSVSYGAWNDGVPGNNAPAAQVGYSLVRVHDSVDSNLDYYDFTVSAISTKGSVNIYVPIPELVNEDSEQEFSGTALTTSTTKVWAKKTEPLYPRIMYQSTTTVGKEINFDASLSTGGEGARRYVWEMDDGGILHGEKITHAYQLADTYSVTLTVFDATGAEKHKTIKVTVISNQDSKRDIKNTQIPEKNIAISSVKNNNKKLDPVAVFTQIGGLIKLKTSSLVRIRGILASVFVTKNGTEFYIIGEPAAGGTAVGTLVKPKNNTIDARVGDTIEITAKYITNATTGNYLQYGINDQLSVINNGGVITPLKSSIKNTLQLSGGYVQISGKVVEKKSAGFVVSDETGELTLVGSIGESLKVEDSVIATGYIMRIKDSVVLRIANNNDVVVQEHTQEARDGGVAIQNEPKKLYMGSVVIGALVCILCGMIIKKLWFNKKYTIDETEI